MNYQWCLDGPDVGEMPVAGQVTATSFMFSVAGDVSVRDNG